MTKEGKVRQIHRSRRSRSRQLYVGRHLWPLAVRAVRARHAEVLEVRGVSRRPREVLGAAREAARRCAAHRGAEALQALRCGRFGAPFPLAVENNTIL